MIVFYLPPDAFERGYTKLHRCPCEDTVAELSKVLIGPGCSITPAQRRLDQAFTPFYIGFVVHYRSCLVSTLDGVSFPATMEVELRAIDLMIRAMLSISRVPISSLCV